jgi:hypothetical protein
VGRLVADHPIAAFLVVGNAVAWAFAVSPVANVEIWLERPLYASLGTILGVGLAALLVTAVADGRAAVVDLLRRTFRWRPLPHAVRGSLVRPSTRIRGQVLVK